MSKEEYQSVFGRLLVCARLLLLEEPRLFWKEDVDKTRDEELSHDHSVERVQSKKKAFLNESKQQNYLVLVVRSLFAVFLS